MADLWRDSLQSLMARSTQTMELFAAWDAHLSGEICTGIGAPIPSLAVRKTCVGDLFSLCVANVYTLLDRAGTNCLEVLANTAETRAAKVIDEYIKPTWSRIRETVIRFRSNYGHHAPYHSSSKRFAQSVLGDLHYGELYSLTYAIHLATYWTAESLGEPIALHGWLVFAHTEEETNPRKFFTEMAERSEEVIRTRLSTQTAARGLKPMLARIHHHTVGVPQRAFVQRASLIGSRNARRLIGEPRQPLAETYYLVRDQFLVTNSLFLTYFAFLTKSLAVGALRACRSESMRASITRTLQLNWYSHVYTLFETDRASLNALTAVELQSLPSYARWLYAFAIVPEWNAHGIAYLELRNSVGFHRERSDRTADEAHRKFLEAVDPLSTTYLMRILFFFFWIVEAWQGRQLDTVTVPHWLPVDVLDPRHRLSYDKEYFAHLQNPTRYPLERYS